MVSTALVPLPERDTAHPPGERDDAITELAPEFVSEKGSSPLNLTKTAIE